jgi:hypothetical protein
MEANFLFEAAWNETTLFDCLDHHTVQMNSKWEFWIIPKLFWLIESVPNQVDPDIGILSLDLQEEEQKRKKQ